MGRPEGDIGAIHDGRATVARVVVNFGAFGGPPTILAIRSSAMACLRVRGSAETWFTALAHPVPHPQ
eukprot:2148933-Pleurochrysis_carterae.AAC.5